MLSDFSTGIILLVGLSSHSFQLENCGYLTDDIFFPTEATLKISKKDYKDFAPISSYRSLSLLIGGLRTKIFLYPRLKVTVRVKLSNESNNTLKSIIYVQIYYFAPRFILKFRIYHLIISYNLMSSCSLVLKNLKVRPYQS